MYTSFRNLEVLEQEEVRLDKNNISNKRRTKYRIRMDEQVLIPSTFRYLEYTIKQNWEIDENIVDKIKARWLKYRGIGGFVWTLSNS